MYWFLIIQVNGLLSQINQYQILNRGMHHAFIQYKSVIIKNGAYLRNRYDGFVLEKCKICGG
jgi:translation elongation factor P/translation initiation factor 5A